MRVSMKIQFQAHEEPGDHLEGVTGKTWTLGLKKPDPGDVSDFVIASSKLICDFFAEVAHNDNDHIANQLDQSVQGLSAIVKMYREAEE